LSIGEALDAVGRFKPNVILIDIHPDTDFMTTISQLAQQQSAPDIIAMSLASTTGELIAVVRAGAKGYISKAIKAAQLAVIIEAVHAGERYYDPSATIGAITDTPNEQLEKLDKLSLRERDVLRLLAKAQTNKEIAEELRIPLTTIQRDIANICSKLGVRNKTAAAVIARGLSVF